MSIWIIVITVLIFTGALAVLFQRNLRNAVITFGVVSLLAALLFAMMKAYDVAITEASIGAVLTMALFFWTIRRLEEDGYDRKK